MVILKRLRYLKKTETIFKLFKILDQKLKPLVKVLKVDIMQLLLKEQTV